MTLFQKILRPALLCLDALIAAMMGAVVYFDAVLPDQFSLVEGQSLELSTSLPVEVVRTGSLASTPNTSQQAQSRYPVSLKLLGCVEIKSAVVNVVENDTVYLGGQVFGVKMLTDGVMVVGLSEIKSEGRQVSPAEEAGLQVGDIIQTMDGIRVTGNADVAKVIQQADGSPVQVKFTRDGKTMTTELKAVLAEDGSYKGGMWVRDSSAGIGTMTYYDPQNESFGGLGHAIYDVDSGKLMPLQSGEIVRAKVIGVVRGESGYPGELRGEFILSEELGTLSYNCEEGLFGHLEDASMFTTPISIAMAQEVQTGPAVMYTTIGGQTVEAFDIEIEKVMYQGETPTKNMQIRVVDPDLKEKTGGIVQGQSGSPIVQNGKLIGAVTHVLVNDPTRGYAIFAENMRRMSNQVENAA